MAIDTHDKRRSAYIGLGLYNVAPVPNGVANDADRPHTRWLYRGLNYYDAPVTGSAVLWRPTWVPRRRA